MFGLSNLTRYIGINYLVLVYGLLIPLRLLFIVFSMREWTLFYWVFVLDKHVETEKYINIL